MDNIEEVLASVTKVPDPPLFVQHNARLFNAWYKWTATYEEPEGKIRPLGQRVGPSWLSFTFDGLEDFYNYYSDLMKQEL